MTYAYINIITLLLKKDIKQYVNYQIRKMEIVIINYIV